MLRIVVGLLIALMAMTMAAAPASAAAVVRWQGAVAYTPGTNQKELVVLVHGLGRSRLSMLPLEWALESEGYEVLNWGYSSFCCTVAALGQQLAADLEAPRTRDAARIHFVGHSLGNIIVRSMIVNDPPANLGRVVMLAPPNQGAASANRYARLLGWLLRPLPELTTDSSSTARRVPLPSTVEFGVIAGEHDGKVALPESHLAGERDHVVVPSSHTFIMHRSDVRRLVGTFLRTGSFVAPGGGAWRESPRRQSGAGPPAA